MSAESLALAAEAVAAPWIVFVLRNIEDQTAAWPLEIFAPICAKDGTAGGSLGVRWQG